MQNRVDNSVSGMVWFKNQINDSWYNSESDMSANCNNACESHMKTDVSSGESGFFTDKTDNINTSSEKYNDLFDSDVVTSTGTSLMETDAVISANCDTQENGKSCRQNDESPEKATTAYTFNAAWPSKPKLVEIECLECGKFFISPEHYKLHVENHAKQKARSLNRKEDTLLTDNNCPEYGKRFNRKDLVKRHIKWHEKQKAKKVAKDKIVTESKDSHRKGKTTFECLQCGKTYKHKGHLKRHEKSHESSVAKTTERIAENAASAANELDAIENNSVIKNESETEYAAGDGENSDIVFDNDDNCEDVYYNYSEENSLESHDIVNDSISENVEQLKQNDDREQSCNEAPIFQVQNVDYLPNSNQVSKEHQGTHCCNVCKKSFKRKDHLRRHMNGHEKRKAKEEQLKARVRSARQGLDSTELGLASKKRHRKYVDVNCQVCGKYFHRMDHLKRHELIHVPEKPEKTHVCLVCHMGFYRPEQLERHERTHDYKCDTCERTFSKQEYLDRHKLCHMFKCEFCNERFPTKAALKEHLVIHKDERPNICHVCGKAFNLRKQLQKHKDVHRARDPNFKPFTCKICGRECKSKRILQRHTADHTGRRDFMCQVCGKAFKVRVDLTKHSVIHFGTRKHKCHICGKGFYRTKDLRRHVAIHGGS